MVMLGQGHVPRLADSLVRKIAQLHALMMPRQRCHVVQLTAAWAGLRHCRLRYAVALSLELLLL